MMRWHYNLYESGSREYPGLHSNEIPDEPQRAIVGLTYTKMAQTFREKLIHP
jgi:hypothetical protein